jgi:hypothetical protein
LVDGATFLLMLVSLLYVLPEVARLRAPADRTDHQTQTSRTSLATGFVRFASSTWEGVGLYRSSSALRASIPLILVVVFSTCIEGVAGVYYLRHVAAGRPFVYGLILASWSVGAAVGSLVTAQRCDLRGELAMLGVGAAFIGAGLCAASTVLSAGVVAVAFFAGGFGNGMFNTAIRTVINYGAPPSRRGLAWGTFRTLSSFVIGLGFVLGAPNLVFTPRQAVAVAGVLPIVMLAVFLRAARKEIPVVG